MSNYSNSRKKSDKDNRYRSRDGQGDKRRSSQPSSRGRGMSPARGRGFGRGSRKVVSFDPSLFLKKVEETTAVQAYVPKNTFSDFSIINQLKNIAQLLLVLL